MIKKPIMNQPAPRIIVDIDNTLWDFASVLYDRLSGYGVPEPDKWHWDFWKSYMPVEVFLQHIDAVHKSQNGNHAPFPESRDFLLALKRSGWHIVVASHREPSNYGTTENWLNYHKLVFDELYVGPDKTVLFDTSAAVIDDSTDTLDKALKKNLIRAGLRYSWNKESDHPLFGNLTDVFSYLERRVPTSDRAS